MPTFKHAWIIRRAVRSLLTQSLQDWELIILDDGSPDRTADALVPYLDDPRIRYSRLARNGGLGAALNIATRRASGTYISYLPSDDVYFPGHLDALVRILDADPGTYLAYGGVVSHARTLSGWSGATLQGDGAVGHEAAALRGELEADGGPRPGNGNLLALVQVMHRRSLEPYVAWRPREEEVSDRLEADFWRELLGRGARFRWTGSITCEWSDHPEQRHKIIAGDHTPLPATSVPWTRAGHGISGYRTYYGIEQGVALNWRSSTTGPIDERRVYARLRAKRLPAPADDGLRILMVGSLGCNPERVLAFEEAGHELYALWSPHPEIWDYAAPLPFGRTTTIPYAPGWRRRVEEIRPDVVYALLNQQALPIIDEVSAACPELPVVFHFKESPFAAMRYGLWDRLRRVLARSDGHVFISEENHEWFRCFFADELGDKPVMLLDGDLPKADWLRGSPGERISDRDGEIHTVCLGRPIGLDDLREFTRLGVHVHFYGDRYHKTYRDWVSRQDGRHLHLHATVHGPDWVRELSRYDGGWLHFMDSHNGGSVRAADWNDLNLPARLGAYVVSGLPLLLKETSPSVTAVRRLADRYDIGIAFRDGAGLCRALADEDRVREIRGNVERARPEFVFDHHVDRLVDFFRRCAGIRRPLAADHELR